jgi:hypothetical protein
VKKLCLYPTNFFQSIVNFVQYWGSTSYRTLVTCLFLFSCARATFKIFPVHNIRWITEILHSRFRTRTTWRFLSSSTAVREIHCWYDNQGKKTLHVSFFVSVLFLRVHLSIVVGCAHVFDINIIISALRYRTKTVVSRVPFYSCPSIIKMKYKINLDTKS